jgi:hypothetical protein
VEPDALGSETTAGERSSTAGVVMVARPGIGAGEGLGGGSEGRERKWAFASLALASPISDYWDGLCELVGSS